MEKIRVDLQNCFGIQDMHHEFDFHGEKVISVYAKNGLMKTSFTKIFQKIQMNKADEICDAIFEDETYPEIVEYLSITMLPELRKAMWISYISNNQSLFDDLCDKYDALSAEIDSIDMDDTPWKQALDIFNKRFSVPFSMRISNLKGAIIGESIPKVEFLFRKGEFSKVIDRTTLEELDTLSQGEKRALYLLNIIFDMEQLEGTTREKVIVVDDIADSFDYKNKYAIIEYLYEIAQKGNFYMLILSHNFDFYRTVSSRLDVNTKNRLMASLEGNTICLKQEHYQDDPLKQWKKQPNRKNVLAMIPFVRNLIDYRKDGEDKEAKADSLLLTSLLHEKEKTHEIAFEQLLPLYQKYIGVTLFEADVLSTEAVMTSLYAACDEITSEDILLENKILLAMGIRHKAEQYMIKAIRNYQGQLRWRKKSRVQEGTGIEFLSGLDKEYNQTRVLMNVYKQFGTPDMVAILNEVNIMTPENIHLNSFMYEPILDMDIVELLALYEKVRDM